MPTPCVWPAAPSASLSDRPSPAGGRTADLRAACAVGRGAWGVRPRKTLSEYRRPNPPKLSHTQFSSRSAHPPRETVTGRPEARFVVGRVEALGDPTWG